MKIEQNYWSQLAGASQGLARMQKRQETSESRATSNSKPLDPAPPSSPGETTSSEPNSTRVAETYEDPRTHGLALGRFNRMLVPLLRHLEKAAEDLTGVKLQAKPISNENAARGSSAAGSLIQSAQFSISTESTRLDVQTEDGSFRYDGRSLTATGLIRTADGMELSFSFSAEFDRLRIREGSQTAESQDGEQQPTVLHYEGSAAEIRQRSFSLQWSLANSEPVSATPAENTTASGSAGTTPTEATPSDNFINDSTADTLQQFSVSA